MHLWKAFLWENQQLIKKHVNTTTFENLLQTVVLIFCKTLTTFDSNAGIISALQTV